MECSYYTFLGFAGRVKLARFERAVVSTVHTQTLPLGVHPGDATWTEVMGV